MVYAVYLRSENLFFGRRKKSTFFGGAFLNTSVQDAYIKLLNHETNSSKYGWSNSYLGLVVGLAKRSYDL
jgi:hypothetical protein